jgi:hypothetical protein
MVFFSVAASGGSPTILLSTSRSTPQALYYLEVIQLKKRSLGNSAASVRRALDILDSMFSMGMPEYSCSV